MTNDDAGPRPVDIDALAAALRWTIGRSPRADEDADRRVLRDVAARLGPDDGSSAAALDRRLDATLAELAATGVVADHCAPRNRTWVDAMARVYLCPPDELPEPIREAIGPTALPFLRDGATNRARAAAAVLGVDSATVRVRREPLLLEAVASALADRATGVDADPVPVAPTPRPASPPAAPRPGLLLAGAAVLVVATAVVTALVTAAVTREDGRRVDTATEQVVDTGPPAPRLGAAPALPSDTVVLGLVDGALVAVGAESTPLGLDQVLAADAERSGDVVHVVARRTDGTVAYAALHDGAGEWREVDTGATDVAVGVDSDGLAVVVAVRGPDGDLARRRVDLDGTPLEPWARLPATGVADADVVTNADGRLEVVGAFVGGASFNVWQTEAPDGWSEVLDRRGGEMARQVQGITNTDGRLELFALRRDAEVWNTWQVAPGRGWLDDWDTRHLDEVTQWRVAVGADDLLVAVAVIDDEVVLRRQVWVPQDDGRIIAQWPPSTLVEPIDPLGSTRVTAASVVSGDDEAIAVVSGAGRTVAVPVGTGFGPERDLAPVALDAIVAFDG